MPRGVDHVISVRPRWSGGHGDGSMRYAVLRIWFDGHVDDLGEATDRKAALTRANEVAASEQTVYMRAPDDVSQQGLSTQTFGDVPGLSAGRSFRRRSDIQAAGLHRSSQGGIDWCSEGALAIVFAGGYVDDHWSEVAPWYTGMGGQDTRGSQVREREPTL